MKKTAVALILAVALCVCGCVPSNEKNTVRELIEMYFSSLQSGDFTVASALAVQVDSAIKSDIDDIDVNRFIFKDISYDIWSIKKDDSGTLYAETVIHQMSLSKAIILTAQEYNEYVSDAQANGRIYSDAALEDKWNSLLLKHVRSIDETVSMRCNIPVLYMDDGTVRLAMTAEFRNCLFGGELDAIKAIAS